MQKIVIFSDPNFLAVGLLENFLSKSNEVCVITKLVDEWKTKTSFIKNINKLSILAEGEFDDDNISYTIVIAGFLGDEPYDFINKIFKKHRLNSSKTLIVIPFEKYLPTNFRAAQLPDNIGVIYLGDLLGPRIDLNSNLFFPYLISKSYFNKTIDFPIGEKVYPVFISDAVKFVSSSLFSFGPFGREVLLVGSEVSAATFWKETNKILGNIKISYLEELPPRTLPPAIETKKSSTNFNWALSETYSWIALNRPLNVKKNKPVLKIKKKARKVPKIFKRLILSFLIILIMPLPLLLVSVGMFYASYNQFLKGKDSSSQNYLLLAKTVATVSKNESEILSYMPILKIFYRETKFISQVFVRGAELGVSTIPIVRSSANLTDKIFGDNVYDPGNDSDAVSLGLESVYREISLLQVDVNSAVIDHSVAANYFLSKFNLEKYKELAYQGEAVSKKLPSILGKGQVKTYLLLFQNNMELRPTGGFIGSFGLLTFDNGRITDLTINDVYSADGQLNGHVEPPTPIKKYLGEANWWLRDSNWDPDFPTSAKRAEWFLDKEMAKGVDGVVAVDLDPVKNALKLIGPVFLSDYNLSISSDNLYEKTQQEVQENFFPGSRKKASFLTALSRSLLSEISKLSSKQKLEALRSFYSDLDERHIQVFMHDEELQSALAKLSWDGSVARPSCGESCYSDFLGDVEANLGVNKANYFIQRDEKLSVAVMPDGVERTFDLTLKNTSNPALGPAGKYKTYIRLLIPSDVDVDSAEVFTGETSESLDPEIVLNRGIKEVGVLVEVLGGQSKRIELKWKSNIQTLSQYSKYGVYIRKQAGVGPDRLNLTVNGEKVYNDTLVDDFFKRFTLK